MPINTELANDVWSRYQYLRDGHKNFILKSSRCEDFFFGIQWDQADLALLKAQKRPALTINKIISTLSSIMGEQIYNRTDIAFKPRNEGATAEVADALSKVFLQISDNNRLPWVRSDVFTDGVISGRGFYDVRLDFSDSLKGEVHIEQLNPKNVLIDADADEYDPDKWGDVIVTKWMSPDQIEMMYSKRDADLLRGERDACFTYGDDVNELDRDRFGGRGTPYTGFGATSESARGTARNIRVLDRQWRKLDKVLHYVNTQTGDCRAVPSEANEEVITDFLQANPQYVVQKKLIHRIRWTVVAGNVVLHDDWSPYKHFTVVPFFPFFMRGRATGIVENLLGPQELLNKTSSQELHVINTSANSGWKVRQNAVKNMTTAELEARGATSGLVLELDELDHAEKIVPNQTPTGLDRVSFKAEESIKTISGVSDYQTGNAREDVSAKALKLNQSRGTANLAKPLDNLVRTDTLLARNILDMVQEYYTEARLVFITTDTINNTVAPTQVNQMTPEGQIVNDLTLGEYGVVVTSRPERELFEESQFDQAVRLRAEVGVPLPDKYIIQASRLKDKNEILQTMEQESQTPEAQANAQLAQRAKNAEVSKLEAETADKVADTQLKSAKAQKEMGDVNGQDAEHQVELHKIELEHELEMKKLEMEMALKRQEMEATIALKREEAAAELSIKKEAAQQQAQTDRIAAITAAKQAPAPGAGGAKPKAKPKPAATPI